MMMKIERKKVSVKVEVKNCKAIIYPYGSVHKPPPPLKGNLSNYLDIIKYVVGRSVRFLF